MLYVWVNGMRSFGNANHPLNITGILSLFILFMPSIYLSGLILVSFARKTYANHMAIIFLAVQFLMMVLLALSFNQAEGKRDFIFMSQIFIVCSIIFWILFAMIIFIKKKCDHL